MVDSRVIALCAAAGLLASVIAGTSALGGGAAPAPATSPASAPAVGSESGERTVEDGGTGKYKAIAVGDSSIPGFTIYRPKDLAAFGDKEKLPILAWGNGGCANSNSGHQNYLSEIASYGFIIVAIGPNQAGGGGRGGAGGAPAGPGGAAPGRGGAMGPVMEEDQLYFVGAPGGAPAGGAPGRGAGGGGAAGGASGSTQLLDAIKWAIAQNDNAQSRYFHKMDTTKVGVFGHSCGGLQALEVSPDPRVTTTIVVDSGILNDSGGGGGAPGGRGAPGAAPGRAPGAFAPTVNADALFFVGAPGGAAPGGRGGAGGAGRGAGGGGGLAGMPPLTKDHLTKLHGPVFYLLGGESDIAYANGMDDFKRIEKLPVFVANKGVGHGGTFTAVHGGDWAIASLAWFQWQLKGDQEAAKLFTGTPPGLGKKEGWTVDKKNIP